jgi:hypothetical protein
VDLNKKRTMKKHILATLFIFTSLITNAQFGENPFYVAAGVGQSYGGAGLRAQVRLGDENGFGFHLGTGVHLVEPTKLGLAGGVKYFPWKGGWYVDVQYGVVGKEQIIVSQTLDTKLGFINEYEYNPIYGPMLMLGGDFAWGKKTQFGFNAALGAAYWINPTLAETLPVNIAADLGIVVRF